MRRTHLNTSIAIVGIALSILGGGVTDFLMPAFMGRHWLVIVLFIIVAVIYVVLDVLQTLRSEISEADKVEHTKEPVRRKPIHRREIYWLTVSLVVIAIVASSYALWRFKQPICKHNPHCVLVAEFTDETNPQRGRNLAREIRSEIVEELGDDVSDAVITLVEKVEDEDEALILAERESALLLVWGTITELDGGQVRVRFEVADLLGVSEVSGLPTYRAEPIKYDPIEGSLECTDCFDVSEGELGQHIDVVAHAATGFLYYLDKPQAAYEQFLMATYCAGQSFDSETITERLTVVEPNCEETRKADGWNPQLLTYYAGKAAARSGEFSDGIRLLEVAADQNHYDPAAKIGIAATYRAWTEGVSSSETLSATIEAEKRIKNLILHVTDDEDLALLHHDLGLTYELAGAWTNAAAEHDEAVQLFGEDFGSYTSRVRQGHALLQARKFTDAEVVLKDAMRQFPNAPWAYLGLARVAWHGHTDVSSAMHWLNQAIVSSPESTVVQLERAELCLSWADYYCAEDAYREALSLGGDSGWLHMRLGDFYRPSDPVLEHQDWEKARLQYELAHNYRSHDPWIHKRLAMVAFNQKEYTSAIEHYETALTLTNEDLVPADLYCSLSSAYERIGRTEKARRAKENCNK